MNPPSGSVKLTTMAAPGRYYVLFCVTSFNSIDEVKAQASDDLAAHIARSKEQYAKGKVLMAGAFLDAPDQPLTTMGLFSSKQDAEEYAAGDPFILKGRVTSWYIREWANIVG